MVPIHEPMVPIREPGGEVPGSRSQAPGRDPAGPSQGLDVAALPSGLAGIPAPVDLGALGTCGSRRHGRRRGNLSVQDHKIVNVDFGSLEGFVPIQSWAATHDDLSSYR